MSVDPLFAPSGAPDDEPSPPVVVRGVPAVARRSRRGDEAARVLRTLDTSIPRLRNALDRHEVEAWVAVSDDPVKALGAVAIWAASADLRERVERRRPLPRSPLLWAAPAPTLAAARGAVSSGAGYQLVPFAGGRQVGPLPEPDIAAPAIPALVPSPATVRRLRVARAALWFRNAGAIILLFVAYQLWGTGFQQSNTQAKLREETAALSSRGTPARTTSAAVASSPSGVPLAGSPGRWPSGGAASGDQGTAVAAPVVLPAGVIAELLIPAIHLDQFVLEGTTDADLERGPGHYIGTPEPGHAGNVAIAGHRTTYGAPFNRLGALRPGDSIDARTPSGDYLYIVTGERSVAPSQTSVIDDYGDNRMTLTTCTPEFLATQRLVVTAALIGPMQTGGSPAAHLSPPAALTTTPKSTNTAAIAALRAASRGFELGALPLALLLSGLLVGLALLYEPLRRRVTLWGAVVLLGPLWLCGLVLLFQRLTMFLPPYI